MINTSFESPYSNLAVCEKRVLIVSDNIKHQVFLTEKCLDVGIRENNIYQCTSIFNIEDKLNNNIAHIIIEAGLYNYYVANALEKSIEAGLLSLFIFHPEDDTKTIRLITDKRLYHINTLTSSVLLKKLFNENR